MNNISDFQHFKTEICQETLCSCFKSAPNLNKPPSDFAECPYYHNKQDKRREPFQNLESLVPAYECKKDLGSVPNFQRCQNIIEELYHPQKFKTIACENCEGYYCPYYHNTKERDQWNKILNRPAITESTSEKFQRKSKIPLSKEEDERNVDFRDFKRGLEPIEKQLHETIEDDEFFKDFLGSRHNVPDNPTINLTQTEVEHELTRRLYGEGVEDLYQQLKQKFNKEKEKEKPLKEKIMLQPQPQILQTDIPTNQEYRGAFDYQQQKNSSGSSDEESKMIKSLLSRKTVKSVKSTKSEKNSIENSEEESQMIKALLNRKASKPSIEIINKEESFPQGKSLLNNIKQSLIESPKRSEQVQLKLNGFYPLASQFPRLSQLLPEKMVEAKKPHTVEEIEAHLCLNSTDTHSKSSGEELLNQSFHYGNKHYYAGDKTDVTENMRNEFKFFKAFDLTYIENLVEKYACSFLNSKGGTLYLGITDFGIVQGIRVSRKNLDEISVAFDRKLKHFIPPVRADQYQIQANFVYDRRTNAKLHDCYIVEIEIKQGDPSDLYFTDKKDCFIRKQASSTLLQPAELKEEIKARTRRQIAKNLVGLLADSGFEESLRRQSVQDLVDIKKDLEQKIKLIDELIEKDKGEYDKHLEKLEKGLLSNLN